MKRSFLHINFTSTHFCMSLQILLSLVFVAIIEFVHILNFLNFKTNGPFRICSKR